jgi:ribosome-associated protein
VSPIGQRAAGRAAVVIEPRDLKVRVDTAGGPGGQHANRTKSRVTVEIDLRSAALEPSVRARLVEAFGSVARSTSSASRSQAENRRTAEERLLGRLATALHEPVERRATKPTRAAVTRRLEAKRRRSSVKRLRGEVSDD